MKKRKKALRRDFWMEVHKSKARFISIFFIVALGVAFYSGIQSASPDMRFSGDAYFDTDQLMDLKVMGTLGLTDRDLKALVDIDGVWSAEGSWSEDVISKIEGSQRVFHVEALTETVNQLTLTEGEMPTEPDECFLDQNFAGSNGYQIGDTIHLNLGEKSLLINEDYTVTGIGTCPMYLSFNRGNTNLGSGEINAFLYVPPESFDSEVFTEAFLLLEDARELISYTDPYKDLISRIQEKVEGIQDICCQERYREVMEEAEEKLKDARKELEDGKKEAREKLTEAEDELKDARKQISDGWTDYHEGKKKLEEAKAELEDGEKQLEDGKKELEDGKKKFADGEKQIASGEATLAASKAQAASGQAELNAAKQQMEEGQQALASGKKEIAAAWDTIHEKESELESGEQQLAEAWNMMESGKTELEQGKEELAAGEIELNAGKQELSAAEEQLNAGRQELQAARSQYDNSLSQIEQGEAAVAQGKASIYSQIEQVRAELDAKTMELQQAIASGTLTPEEQRQKEIELGILRGTATAQITALQLALAPLEIQEQTLAAGRRELEASLPELVAAESEFAAKESEFHAAKALLAEKEAELVAARQFLEEKEQELLAGEAELKQQQKAFQEGKEQFEAGKQELQEKEEQLKSSEQELLSGQQQLAASEQVLQSGWAAIAAGEQELAAGRRELEKSRKTIEDGEKEIRENEEKLKDGKKEIEDGEKDLKDGRKELYDGFGEYRDGFGEYHDGKKEALEEITDGEQKLADAEQEIQDIKKPKWYVTDRTDLPEYSDYGDNADRIKNLGAVFPVLFFLVAALISLTTMTRMVEEYRTQIGTMKALGYSKVDIASKYICYAFLATVGGSILGVLIGEKLIPFIIIKAYGIMYLNIDTHMKIDYEYKYALIAAGLSCICTIGATLSSCYRALMETPASLMRPPAPKVGKRVFLERIPFIWKNLSFTWKSTMRNLFRYKKRFFMTIFGISGSMALMLLGFGLRDSIMDIAVKQYENIQHYEAMIIKDEDATEQETQALLSRMAAMPEISHYNEVRMVKMTTKYNTSNLGVYLYVPENLDTFAKDVTLQDRISRKQYQIDDSGVVICEKTARLLNLKKGDLLTLIDDNEKYEVPVSEICENYMAHYVYMTPELYRQTFGEAPEYNEVVFTVVPEEKQNLSDIGQRILDQPAALSISYTSSLKGQLDRMLTTLGSVIWVLIISAGLLAFVVLYNLNNINITERQRELATLKVLGFYDGEVSQYVFRENILLTVIGIIAGCFLGIALHRFVIVTVEVDAVMFGRDIKWISFLYSALLTSGFSVFVNFVMHHKLKKINMVESLKSVE